MMSASGSPRGGSARWLRWVPLVVLIGIFVALTLVWRSPSMSRWLDPVVLTQVGTDLLATPLGPLAVLAGYVLAVVLAMPIALMITVGVLVFGAWPGMLYALLGMLSGAVVTYGIGRLCGTYLLQRFADPSVLALGQRLQNRSLLMVVFVRVVPVAPFLILNITAGALKIRLRDYVLGTFLGLLPGVILMGLFMDRLTAAWRDPGLGSYVGLGLWLALVVGVAWLLRKRLMAMMAAEVNR